MGKFSDIFIDKFKTYTSYTTNIFQKLCIYEVAFHFIIRPHGPQMTDTFPFHAKKRNEITTHLEYLLFIFHFTNCCSKTPKYYPILTLFVLILLCVV